jgi:hypothetical protein
MMGTFDPNYIPAHAVTMWATENDIFVALPMTTGGVPYIARYPKSSGGLAQALAVLCARQPEVPKPSTATPANYTQTLRQPQVKLDRHHERLKAETTEAQREAARQVLAKLGLK